MPYHFASGVVFDPDVDGTLSWEVDDETLYRNPDGDFFLVTRHADGKNRAEDIHTTRAVAWLHLHKCDLPRDLQWTSGDNALIWGCTHDAPQELVSRLRADILQEIALADREDLRHIKALLLALRVHRGIDTPAEQFLQNIVMNYGLWGPREITPSLLERDLEELADNWRDMELAAGYLRKAGLLRSVQPEELEHLRTLAPEVA